MFQITRLLSLSILVLAAMSLAVAGCGEKKTTPADNGTSTASNTGNTSEDDHDHGHDDEISLGTTMIGDMTVECAQGHGEMEPGKESHLVVKLPYNDNGATIVRAWIGTDDRFMSTVGKGEYAASHDDYDIHAMAPAPLPEGAQWWIEIEKPDGTTVVGSIDFH